MIEEFVEKLQFEIETGLSKGFLKSDYFTTITYNHQSEVHSRIMGLIVRVCHTMDFDVEIERGFNYMCEGKNVRFKPDVVTHDSGAVDSFIEYESTNSSDARFYDMNRATSDLRNLEYFSSSGDPNNPRRWIVILTLPRAEVKRTSWGSWELRKSDAEFARLIQCPYDFYYPTCLARAEETYKKRSIASDLHLLNIDRGELRLEASIVGERESA